MAEQKRKKPINFLRIHLAKILRDTVYLSETEFTEKMPKVASKIDRLSNFYGERTVAVYLNQALKNPFYFMFKYHPEPAIRKSMVFTHSIGFSKLATNRIQDIIAATGNNILIDKTVGWGLGALISLGRRFAGVQKKRSRKNPGTSLRKRPSNTGPKRL